MLAHRRKHSITTPTASAAPVPVCTGRDLCAVRSTKSPMTVPRHHTQNLGDSCAEMKFNVLEALHTLVHEAKPRHHIRSGRICMFCTQLRPTSARLCPLARPEIIVRFLVIDGTMEPLRTTPISRDCGYSHHSKVLYCTPLVHRRRGPGPVYPMTTSLLSLSRSLYMYIHSSLH